MSEKLTMRQVTETAGVETVLSDRYMYNEDSDKAIDGDGTNFIIRVVRLTNGDFYALCDVPISSSEDLEYEAIGPFETEREAIRKFYCEFS